MDVDEEMSGALDLFVTEARDLLQEVEEDLLRLEEDPTAGDTVNSLFRAVHTLKGSSGLFGFGHMVRFTHVLEALLDSVRLGDLDVTPDLISALLPCADHLSSLVEGAVAGRLEATEAQRGIGAELIEALEPFLAASGAAGPGYSELAEASRGPAADAEERTWRLSLRFGPDSLRNGMDPLAFIRYLSTLATVTWVATVTDAMPAAEEMDPETCYLGFEVEYVTRAAKAEIESVFEFVRDDSDIRIEEFPAPAVDAGLRKKPKASEARTQDTSTLRVDAARLDKLVDLVGELVIAQASAGVRVFEDDRASLVEAQGEVMRLVEEVRDGALSLRMVPIATTFRRFERVVRDVSVELDKEVALVVTGADSEVDKALVERIGDPLLHLVRNCLDHGIEPRGERLERGKPACGRLRLNAFHDAGSIVIEVADDGRGLDRERLLARAVERGLVEPGAGLTDQEVYELIFEPGFSTAATVSNLSGRGVGMDVVRRNVTALRGTIEVETTLGKGTTMRIRLPLTLAIIDGFLVGVGPSSFIVPLDRVTECVELPPGDLARECMDLRGEVLPFIRLRAVFGIPGEPARRQCVVVVEQSGQRTGLVVDALMGEVQTVIKPLGPLFSQARCISGSTILGNGEVALILDVGPLIVGQIERERAQLADPIAMA